MSHSKHHKLAIHLHQNVPADWYDKSIKENLLQRYWHKKRFKEVNNLIIDFSGVALDIGCADGTFTSQLIENSKIKKIYGLDVLEDSINYAKKKYQNDKRFSFQSAEAHKLPFNSESFDYVFCLETLEHVVNPKKVLLEIKRVTKKNGKIILLVPSENLLFKIIWFFWTKGRGKIWRGSHLHHYSNNQLIKIAQAVGFNIELNRKFQFGMLQLIRMTHRSLIKPV